MGHSWSVKRGDAVQAVEIAADRAGVVTATVDGRAITATLAQLPDGRWAVSTAEGRQLYRVFRQDGQWVVVAGTDQHRFEVQDARTAWLAGSAGKRGGGGVVKASMPGRVVRIAVQVGDVVADGGVVAVLEAMKMENDVKVARGGVVKRIAVQLGATVETNMVLLELEPAP